MNEIVQLPISIKKLLFWYFTLDGVEREILKENRRVPLALLKSSANNRIDSIRSGNSIYHGLCCLFERSGIELPKALFKSWPKFSGDSIYPVPHPTKEPDDAFFGCPNLYRGEYGQNRIELAEYCVARINQTVDKCQAFINFEQVV